jgi:hypothetical protein
MGLIILYLSILLHQFNCLIHTILSLLQLYRSLVESSHSPRFPVNSKCFGHTGPLPCEHSHKLLNFIIILYSPWRLYVWKVYYLNIFLVSKLYLLQALTYVCICIERYASWGSIKNARPLSLRLARCMIFINAMKIWQRKNRGMKICTTNRRVIVNYLCVCDLDIIGDITS